jgi:hypothetical protein
MFRIWYVFVVFVFAGFVRQIRAEDPPPTPHFANETGVPDINDERHRLRDIDSRIMTADAIARRGHKVNWEDYSLSELNDIKQRILAADYLGRHGIDVDWQSHSLNTLTDELSRVFLSDVLARDYNHRVDWHDFTYSDLQDMKDRIDLARFITHYYHHQIDWREHSLAKMQAIRTSLIASQVRARYGDRPLSNLENVSGSSQDDSEIMKMAQVLSKMSGRSIDGLMTLMQTSRQMLANQSIEVSDEMLLIAITEMNQIALEPTVADCLARYIEIRRAGVDHADVVREFRRQALATEQSRETLAKLRRIVDSQDNPLMATYWREFEARVQNDLKMNTTEK